MIMMTVIMKIKTFLPNLWWRNINDGDDDRGRERVKRNIEIDT